MFGKIIKIEDKMIEIENLSRAIQANVINFHVIFDEDEGGNASKIVGEITGMNEEKIQILLIGEIRNNTFISGVIKYPTLKSKCRVVYKQELEMIIGKQDYNEEDTLLIGASSLYEGFNVTAKINEILTHHMAIIGNSGCGKSCGVASLIQNLFYYNKKSPINAHMVVFDVYG